MVTINRKNWVRRWIVKQLSKLTTKRRKPSRLSMVEALEHRTMLTAYVVNTTVDDGLGGVGDTDGFVSLREAIEAANSDAIFGDAAAGTGADTITFDTSVFGTSKTITLDGAHFGVIDELDITGPEATLTLDGNDSSRIFAHSEPLTLRNLNLTGGNGTAGTSTAVITAPGPGGAIFANGFANGTLTLIDSAVYGNTVVDGTSPGRGGGIFNLAGATIINSTISGNVAEGFGGGIYLGSGTNLITNSTITGNVADSDDNSSDSGGGIGRTSRIDVTLNNTIVAGNFVNGMVTADDLNFQVVATGSNNLIGDADSSGKLTDGTNGNIVGNSGTGTRDINTVLNTTLTNTNGSMVHQILTSGPAYNNGSNALSVDETSTALQSDQRGAPFARVVDGTVDIGAFEATVTAPDDHGNDFQNATSLTISTAQAGLIDYVGDQDWFVLPVITGLEYTFTATQVDLDGILRLYESDGTTLIDSGDGSGQSEPDTITWTADFTGDAYLKMEHQNNTATGDYELTAKVTVDDVAGWNATTGRWYFGENTNSTIDQQIGPRWDPNAGWDIHEGDFNGDGVQDYAGRKDSGEWYVIDGATKTSNYWGGAWGSDAVEGWNDPAFQGIVDVGDFNGDGRDDVFGKNLKNEFYVSLSRPNNRFSSATRVGRVAEDVYAAHRLGDFNGDGMTDIVSFHNNGSRWISESDGTAFTLDYHGKVSSQAVAGWQNFLVGDFNGDDYDDVLQQDSNGQWWKGSSNQAENGSFITSYANRWNPTGFVEYKIGDFNGDGMDDMVGRTINSNQFWMNRSLENGRMQTEFWNGWGVSGDYSTVVGDFNGDGLDDIAGVRESDGHWYLQTAIPKTGGGHKFTNGNFGSWSNFAGVNQIFTGINDLTEEEAPLI